MKWSAEQIREWFEAGQREAARNEAEAKRWVWQTEVRQFTPEELEALHAEHINV